jgi:hypothetical protein
MSLFDTWDILQEDLERETGLDAKLSAQASCRGNTPALPGTGADYIFGATSP